MGKETQLVAVIFVALVAIVTANFGRKFGLLTVLASALAFNFFFVPPPMAFTVPTVGEGVFYTSLLACALLIRRVN